MRLNSQIPYLYTEINNLLNDEERIETIEMAYRKILRIPREEHGNKKYTYT